MNKDRSVVFSVLAVILALILASSALSLPMIDFKSISSVKSVYSAQKMAQSTPDRVFNPGNMPSTPELPGSMPDPVPDHDSGSDGDDSSAAPITDGGSWDCVGVGCPGVFGDGGSDETGPSSSGNSSSGISPIGKVVLPGLHRAPSGSNTDDSVSPPSDSSSGISPIGTIKAPRRVFPSDPAPITDGGSEECVGIGCPGVFGDGGSDDCYGDDCPGAFPDAGGDECVGLGCPGTITDSGSDECYGAGCPDAITDGGSWECVGDCDPDFEAVPGPFITKRADLTVSKFIATKMRAAYGDEIGFKFTITNQGNRSASFNYMFVPDYDPRGIGIGEVHSLSPRFEATSFAGSITLDPGASFTDYKTYAYGKSFSGVVHPTVIVDQDNAIEESDESNNQATLSVLLHDASSSTAPDVTRKPDLVAEAVRVHSDSGVSRQVDFEVTIRNIGAANADGADFSYNYGEGAAGRSEMFNLAAGESHVERLTHVYDHSGPHVLSVVADPDSRISESDETNNRDLAFVLIFPAGEIVFACSDGIDNDGDGLVDRADSGCVSDKDDDESNPAPVECVDSDGGLDYSVRGETSGLNLNGEFISKQDFCINLAEGHLPVAEGTHVAEFVCNDGVLMPDYNHECEYGCVDGACRTESTTIATQCSDGLDNDADGLVDDLDPGCESETDDAESIASEDVCNGLDDDANGFTDVVPQGEIGRGFDGSLFAESYAAVCTAQENCGQYGNDCGDASRLHCEILPEYAQGAMCVCNAGWSGCSDACDTYILTDTHNCGGCGVECPGSDTCQDGVCFPATEIVVECNDGLDNDDDGLVDDLDPGCDSDTDDDEFNVDGGEGNETGGNETADNLPPVAVLSVTPLNGTAPLEVTIDGSGSYDSDGSIVGYSLVVLDPDGYPHAEFGDEGVPGVFSLELPSAGDYPVMLTVTDDDGAAVSVDATVQVFSAGGSEGNETGGNETGGNETVPGDNIAPVALLIVSSVNGTAPLEVSLDGSGSYDADGSIASHSWVISGPEGYVYADTDVAGVPGVLNMTFDCAGDYIITLIVADDDGIAVSAEASVHVVGSSEEPGNETGGNETGGNETGNQAPVAVIIATPSTGVAPLNITLDGCGSYDDVEIVSHSWVVTGTDGFAYQLADVAGVPSSINLILAGAGNYSVTLVVVDSEGVSGSATVGVAVTALGNESTPDNDDDDDDDESGAPSISQRAVKEVTSSSAKVTWQTDIEADSKVLYGTEEDDLEDDESDSDETESHSIELTGLESETRYYYTIISCADGECTEAGPYYFTTLTAGSGVVDDEDDYDDSEDEGSDYEDDLLEQNMGLLGEDEDSYDYSSGSDEPAAVVTGTKGVSGSNIEVVFAKPQFIEVEDEVCKFKFLWWCLWKDMVMKKIPIPALASGVQFVV